MLSSIIRSKKPTGSDLVALAFSVARRNLSNYGISLPTMRLSTRLLSNAASTYVRLGTTFLLGLFTTWYTLGEAGVIGFSLIALAVSSTGPSHALERAIRLGLVRELAAAVASGDQATLRRSVASAFRLCLQAAVPLAGLVAILAALAAAGVFNIPSGYPQLGGALVVLIAGEGVHAAVRLLCSPYTQSLFAAQHVGLNNMVMVVARSSYALSAVLVFGWLLPDASLAVQLVGFAISRATLQVSDVALGVWLAKRHVPDLSLQMSAFDEEEYRSVRSTVWHSGQVDLLMYVNHQFLAVLINLFFGLAYNGIWQIVIQFSGFVRVFSEGLLHGIAPLATHLHEEGRQQAVMDLMARSIRYQLAVTMPAAIVLGLWVRPLLQLWVGGRLAADPNLEVAGLSVAGALSLAATMALILLVVQALRASFFGVERVLYGIGKVRSYAWFSKWATLIVIGSSVILMPWLREPIVAPLALLVAFVLYSPCVILLAARRETGLPIWTTLRRSATRPLLVNMVFFGLLGTARLYTGTLTVVSFGMILIVSALVYGGLAWLAIPEADERQRLGQFLRQGFRWLLQRRSRREK